MVRFTHPGEELAVQIKQGIRAADVANTASGTEKAQTRQTAIQAAADSMFAKDLAEQLEVELAPLPGQIQSALADAAAALAEAGLARGEAADAVADAAQAAADAADAIDEALAAAALASGSNTWADRAPVAADAAGKPLGAVWFQMDATDLLVGFWELQSLGWISRDMSETVIPKIAIGTGTYGTLSGSRLVARSILAEHIQALAITANELAANSVTAVKIAADSVTAEKILAGSVTTEKLYALSVTADKIAVGAIIAEKIAAGAITTGKLAATAIDGMVITGAVIRTAATGQRMQFDVDGLKSFSSSGVLTSLLSAYNGNFSLSSISDDKQLVLSPQAMWFRDNDTNQLALQATGLQVYPFAGLVAQYVSDRAFIARDVINPTTGAAKNRVEMTAETDHSVTIRASIYPEAAAVRSAGASLSASFDSSGVPYSRVVADIGLLNEIRTFNAGDPVPQDLPLNIVSPQGVAADGKLFAGDALRGNATKMNALSSAGKAYDGLRFWRTDLNSWFTYVAGAWAREPGLIASGTIFAQSTIDITGLSGADRYEVALILPTASVANAINARLLTGSTPNTASLYDRQFVLGAGSAAGGGMLVGANNWDGLTGGSREQKTIVVTVHNLNHVEATFADVAVNSWNAAGDGIAALTGLRHRAVASFNGIRFYTNTGTVTGRYEVRAL